MKSICTNISLFATIEAMQETFEAINAVVVNLVEGKWDARFLVKEVNALYAAAENYAIINTEDLVGMSQKEFVLAIERGEKLRSVRSNLSMAMEEISTALVKADRFC